MIRAAFLAAAVFAALATACAPAAPPAAHPPSTHPPSTQPQPSPVAGPMTEEAFAALHELRPDGGPKPAGRRVALEDVSSSAYLALPPGAKAPVPGVVVIHEWWGLNDHIRRCADRLAADGFAALAVDLYEGKVAATREEASALVKTVTEDRGRDVIAAALRFLETSPDVRAPRTAALGWCFGGLWSLRTATDAPSLDACVIFYGQPVTDRGRLARVPCPVLGIYGSRDASIPQEKIDALRAALGDLGKSFTVRMWDAEHAFANPSGPRYASQPAREAWDAARAFLGEHLRK
ncbi:MAG: hypothetical protein HMLKMBBP_00237 [Planctomycetes bacterium]|nr:hypothetical protein [Planctomycetota bacterium]